VGMCFILPARLIVTACVGLSDLLTG